VEVVGLRGQVDRQEQVVLAEVQVQQELAEVLEQAVHQEVVEVQERVVVLHGGGLFLLLVNM
jgi:hypothetical protein